MPFISFFLHNYKIHKIYFAYFLNVDLIQMHNSFSPANQHLSDEMEIKYDFSYFRGFHLYENILFRKIIQVILIFIS